MAAFDASQIHLTRIVLFYRNYNKIKKKDRKQYNTNRLKMESHYSTTKKCHRIQLQLLFQS